MSWSIVDYNANSEWFTSVVSWGIFSLWRNRPVLDSYRSLIQTLINLLTRRITVAANLGPLGYRISPSTFAHYSLSCSSYVSILAVDPAPSLDRSSHFHWVSHYSINEHGHKEPTAINCIANLLFTFPTMSYCFAANLSTSTGPKLQRSILRESFALWPQNIRTQSIPSSRFLRLRTHFW